MRLAEMCNTALSYIGEIEIGRRFPSIKLIEKIVTVLKIEPYLYIIEETAELQNEVKKIINLLSKLPNQQRIRVVFKISASN